MIPLHCMGMLLYLFCDGKTEDNLLGIFNLFDEDGNGTISIDELLNMMAFFIEIGADSGSVDMATVMAEMFVDADRPVAVLVKEVEDAEQVVLGLAVAEEVEQHAHAVERDHAVRFVDICHFLCEQQQLLLG